MVGRIRRDRDRLLMAGATLCLVALPLVLCLEAAEEGHAVAVGVGWAVALAATLAWFVVLRRRGPLVPRRAADRERQLAVTRRNARWTGPGVAALLGVAVAFGEVGRYVALAALGGFVTAVAPLALWIVFVLRPEPGKDLPE